MSSLFCCGKQGTNQPATLFHCNSNSEPHTNGFDIITPCNTSYLAPGNTVIIASQTPTSLAPPPPPLPPPPPPPPPPPTASQAISSMEITLPSTSNSSSVSQTMTNESSPVAATLPQVSMISPSGVPAAMPSSIMGRAIPSTLSSRTLPIMAPCTTLPPLSTSMELMVVPTNVNSGVVDTTVSSITVTSYEKSTSLSVGGTTFQPSPIATSPVLMVYDLDPLKSNCDKLFNIFCLYGNVVRVKFLKTKEGCAMIQMSDQFAVDRCMANLNPTDMLNGRELTLGYSKQPFVSENRGSFTLPDGTEGFKDYSSHRHNRYYNQISSQKNRIQPPSRILHFYNTPTNITEEELINVFNDTLDNVQVVRLKLFPKRGGADGIVRNSTGLVEFNSIPEALEALMVCNHLPVKSQGNKFPYIMKLCFSAAKNIHHIPRDKVLSPAITSSKFNNG